MLFYGKDVWVVSELIWLKGRISIKGHMSSLPTSTLRFRGYSISSLHLNILYFFDCLVSKLPTRTYLFARRLKMYPITPQSGACTYIKKQHIFASDQMVSYISACPKLCGCKCMHQYTKHV